MRVQGWHGHVAPWSQWGRKLEGTQGAEHCLEEVVPVPSPDGHVSLSKAKLVRSHCLLQEPTKLGVNRGMIQVPRGWGHTDAV